MASPVKPAEGARSAFGTGTDAAAAATASGDEAGTATPVAGAEPGARQLVHTRAVTCRGYLRADGLWDIEGHLADSKTYAFANAYRGTIEPGEPLHGMWLRLTVDDELRVRAVACGMDATPYAMCPAVLGAFQGLVGLRIGRGWRREVARVVGGVKGCTHLVELLGPIATAAYQTIYPYRARSAAAADATRVPGHLDACHALARSSPEVRRHYPRWYRCADAARLDD